MHYRGRGPRSCRTTRHEGEHDDDSDAFDPYVDSRQVVLLVEVSESSLRKDRNVKAPLFARYGMSEYWIVNVVRREVEVYSNPLDGAYSTKRTFRPDEPIVSTVLPGPPIAPAEFIIV